MELSHGITGNFYVTAKTQTELIPVCKTINKSINSIYYNNKYKVWAIRIKTPKHKQAIKEYFKK